MLWALFVVLLLAWLAAMVASFTLGGLIHALIVLAVLVLLAQVITDSGDDLRTKKGGTRPGDQQGTEPEHKHAA